MPERRFRVLVIASHPVQYSSPVFRLMAQHPKLDFHVAYCSLRGVEAGHDPEFGRSVQWDIPLLDSHSWTHVQNRGSGGESFFGLYNSGLWKLIREGRFDAVLCHTGYLRASFWISYFAAKSAGAAFLFGTDATTLDSRDHRQWKRLAKRIAWPLLFRLADQVVVPSSGTRDLILSLGIPADRVTLTPYAVDNDWWSAQSARVDRDTVRASWGATPANTVVLFCAKLQPWKRPLDLLRAFARANLPNAYLLFAGDGPLRQELEKEAVALGINARVRFLGFVNQSQLPALYTSADVMVLPSEYEPFGVVVNEAMLCGCPVVVSDRVGAAVDLVTPLYPQFIFHCGDINGLAGILSRSVADGAVLKEFSRRGIGCVRSRSPEKNVAATVEALDRAVSRRPLHAGDPVETSLPGYRVWFEIMLAIWMVSAQVWYYLQFKEQFRSIFWLTLHRLWR
jgi:glycosyltransferase involved in cell wall biosynthesis